MTLEELEAEQGNLVTDEDKLQTEIRQLERQMQATRQHAAATREGFQQASLLGLESPSDAWAAISSHCLCAVPTMEELASCLACQLVAATVWQANPTGRPTSLLKNFLSWQKLMSVSFHSVMHGMVNTCFPRCCVLQDLAAQAKLQADADRNSQSVAERDRFLRRLALQHSLGALPGKLLPRSSILIDRLISATPLECT